MTHSYRSVTTPDGRSLETAAFGDANGPAVFFHHGTPSALSQANVIADAAAAHGLFVVSMSRPGYGSSARLAGRDVAAVVADVRVALDAWGRDRYVSVGLSGGGPHSLACAALDAGRCVAAISVAGVAPRDVDFDWTDGMGQENVDEFRLAQEGGPAFDEATAAAGAIFADVTADNVVPLFGGLLCDEDAAALESPAAREWLAASSRDAVREGPWGLYDDDRAFVTPWGFDVADVAVPTEVWFADHDLMVPPSHGEWLAAHVANATRVGFTGEGHLSLIIRHADALCAALAKAS